MTEEAEFQLAGSMTGADAFRTIARASLALFRHHRDAVSQSGDPAPVHQARIALRKLRTAIRLFRPRLAGPTLPALRADLKWIADELGVVRSLDVAAQRITEPSAQAWIESARRNALARARLALTSPRFEAVMHELDRWLASGVGQDDRPVAEAAADILDLWRIRVKRRGARLAAQDAAALHRLRIDIKRLRYAAEFFVALPGKRRRGAFIETLVELQGHLGDLSDRASLPRVLEALGLPRATIEKLLAGDGDGGAERERHRAAESFKAWRGIKPYWRQRSRA